MKKILFLFFCVLLITGCDLFPSAEETCEISVVCDSNGTVSPSQLTVEKGSPAQLVINPFTGCTVKSITINGEPIMIPSNNIISISDTYHDQIVVKVEIMKKEVYTVTSSCDEYSTVTPSGVVSFLEGDSLKVTATAKSFCSIVNIKVNGNIVNGVSYTFKENGTFEVTSQKESESEWYLCQGKWKNIAQFFGEVEYNPLDEILIFSSDGTYKRYFNGEYRWCMKWWKKDSIININMGGWPSIVDTVDNDNMSFHYIGYTGTIITKVYQNIGN